MEKYRQFKNGWIRLITLHRPTSYKMENLEIAKCNKFSFPERVITHFSLIFIGLETIVRESIEFNIFLY